MTRSALQIAVSRGQAVFSSTCLVHCLTSDTELYKGITVSGASFMDAATSWSAGASPVDISACDGYSCVSQCPGGSTIENIGEAEIAADEPPGPAALDNVWDSQNAAMMGGGGGGATAWMNAGR
jgi:hypothetical protein